MRLFEITDKNQMILSMLGIKKEIIDTEYEKLIKLLTGLIHLKSRYRNQNALPYIKNFEDLISNIINNKLLDKTDPDIISLINSLSTMQAHINSLKSQLFQ